jgi:Coenzyme PQQ synthesis protein D (PqqD)
LQVRLGRIHRVREESLGSVRVPTDQALPALLASERTHPGPRIVPPPMDADLSVHSIVIATPEQVSCPLGEESAILNLKNTVYYGLNPVGARVWNLLQQARTVGELRDAILDEYDVEAGRCESDLLELLEKMRSEGLIHVRSAATR